MIFGQKLKLLSLIVLGAVFSSPTLACDAHTSHQIILRKHEYQSGDCTSLEIVFPKTIDLYSKPLVTLQWEDGKANLLRVDLLIDDSDSDGNQISSSFCLTDELMKRASIGIGWAYHQKLERASFCGPTIVIHNLFQFLESGGKTMVKPFVE